MCADIHPRSREANPSKALYRQLRELTCEQLWEVEVPRFERADAQERIERVAVIRAVGVVLAESGTAPQKAAARDWLRKLLQDPAEKVRRYAMNALPKLGAGSTEESALLTLVGRDASEREQKSLGSALAKIGGATTLQTSLAGPAGPLRQAEQRIKARLARDRSPSGVNLQGALTEFADLRIHLRGRQGLETIVANEVREFIGRRGLFRLGEVRPGCVELSPAATFTLADLYELRCFDTVGLVLGSVNGRDETGILEALAHIIISPRSRLMLQTLTLGTIRYRLDMVGKGHQRAVVRRLAERAYELGPDILNDSSHAPWTIEIHAREGGATAELVPKLKPDPRLFYRRGDVPAASHPPLAACMARLAGLGQNEVVWDPFCGSGLELIERALLGGVRQVVGTDLDPAALAVAKDNFAAARLPSVQAQFSLGDFRDFAQVPGLGPDTVSLIITNPPMGMRVRTPDLRGLMADLLSVAATVLQPGGRLVFPNPVRLAVIPPVLRLESAGMVDLGGFECRLERYRKQGAPPGNRAAANHGGRP